MRASGLGHHYTSTPEYSNDNAMRTFYAFSIPLLTASVHATNSCQKGFTLCAPPGATSSITPQILSPSFPNLFTDIILSSLPSSSPKRSNNNSNASLCCNTLLSCLTMSQLALPFCYDRFTTNYYLPDGSFGTVVNGAYTSATGDVANLETGEYTLVSGQKGNIYPNSEGPDTKTLPMPSQFTGTGVGSAVPASSLGNAVTITYTTTLPGLTREAVTLPATTVASVSEETLVLTSSVEGAVGTTTQVVQVPVSITVGTSTVPGSTVEGVIMTVTTTNAAGRGDELEGK